MKLLLLALRHKYVNTFCMHYLKVHKCYAYIQHSTAMQVTENIFKDMHNAEKQ